MLAGQHALVPAVRGQQEALRLRRDAVGGEADVAPYSMALRARRKWSALQQISAAKVVSGRCAMRVMRLSYGMETI